MFLSLYFFGEQDESSTTSMISAEPKYITIDQNLRSENLHGQYVDRGVGNSPRIFHMENWKHLLERERNLDAAPQVLDVSLLMPVFVFKLIVNIKTLFSQTFF